MSDSKYSNKSNDNGTVHRERRAFDEAMIGDHLKNHHHHFVSKTSKTRQFSDHYRQQTGKRQKRTLTNTNNLHRRKQFTRYVNIHSLTHTYTHFFLTLDQQKKI